MIYYESVFFSTLADNVNLVLSIYTVNFGASPSVSRALMLAVEELHFWDLTGARGITHLLALAPHEG